MKATIDPELCIGCTQCVGICPQVFSMEGSLAVPLPGELPLDTVSAAMDAAQSCPVGAITIDN